MKLLPFHRLVRHLLGPCSTKGDSKQDLATWTKSTNFPCNNSLCLTRPREALAGSKLCNNLRNGWWKILPLEAILPIVEQQRHITKQCWKLRLLSRAAQNWNYRKQWADYNGNLVEFGAYCFIYNWMFTCQTDEIHDFPEWHTLAFLESIAESSSSSARWRKYFLLCLSTRHCAEPSHLSR